MLHPDDLRQIDPRLQQMLHDETAGLPSAANRLAAIRLAELPVHLVDLLLAHHTVRAIYIGPGPVPALDDMGHLHGRPVSEERSAVLWDHTVAAFRDTKLLLGDVPGRSSASCDVPAHEIGHAICVADDLACYQGGFAALYRKCVPVLRVPWNDRYEFFAEVVAAVLIGNAQHLVGLVGGDVDLAERLWVWCVLRYRLR